MKRVYLLALLAGLFLFGCAGAKQSQFFQHSSMYKSWDHLKFSWFGHKNSTPETAKKSQEQGWWGMDIPYIPAK